MTRVSAICLGAALFVPSLFAQQHVRDVDIHDADTLAWWHTTEFLSSDAMQGRDTGSAAYQRAADYVAERMKAAGLQAAGNDGSYLQNVKMHEVDVDPETVRIEVNAGENRENSFLLKFLADTTISVTANLPKETHGDLVFRGYCGKEQMVDVVGKAVICFGTQREGLPTASERYSNVNEAHAAAILTVDDPYFTIEPPRWPYAYARSVTLAYERERVPVRASISAFRVSPYAFERMLAGTAHDAKAILKSGGAKEPLENFELAGRSLHAHVDVAAKDISSPNILGIVLGSDPVLKDEYLVLSAHLDGYGFGTPVNGDKLYNGALDDAAYVALLLQYADDVKAGKLPRPKRSVFLAVFTGEEKGLLGSTWFVQRPTVAKEKIVADINLDQLRPLFPLKILTVPGIGLTTLSGTARAVASEQHIELRDDREPERGLLRRADNWPFLRAGIPAIGFVFGFDPGTDAEQRYREWYQVRYHRPQDDVTQPIDFTAAHDFNAFFYKLADAVADVAERPKIVTAPPK